MQDNTQDFFENGKLSFVMDGSAGSSGKSLISSYLVKNANKKVDFLISAFTPNASHTVIDDDGFEFVFKILGGGSQYHKTLDAVYLVDNSAIEVDTLFKEMDIIGIPRNKVRISPRCMVVQQIDKDMESGLCDIDGNYYAVGNEQDGTVKTGTTASGSGAVLAKKIMRNKTLVTVKDIPELADMIYPMDEIINRLEDGQCGLMEICQGFPLSVNHHKFAPYTTSRNVTVSNAMNDAMLPPKYAGNLLLNWRTFPIKIHRYKYKDIKTDEFIVWDEVQRRMAIGEEHTFVKIESHSGEFYDDQVEVSWEDVTKHSGSLTPIMECTTLTKLPRRVADFSTINLEEAIKFNDTGGKIWLCVNFINYLDVSLFRVRNWKDVSDEANEKMAMWKRKYLDETISKYSNVTLRYYGTGERINDRLVFSK